MAGNKEVFQKLMNAGHSAAWDQNWVQAAGAYQQALAEFPENPKALNSFALANFQLQKFDEALKAYMHAARVSPDDPTPFEKIAQINERAGNIKNTILASLYAAELYLKLHDLDKALQNWWTVIQLDPENLQARSRLALIFEKTGQTRESSFEYIAAASILQNRGDPQKALELVKHALQFDPDCQELKEILHALETGQVLPKPSRPKGGTGALRMAAVNEMVSSPEQVTETPDPVVEARQKALKVFADVLFDIEDDSREAVARRELAEVVKTAGRSEAAVQDQAKVLKHLSAAIDAQMKENDELAGFELQQAVAAGFNHQAAYFDIGLMLSGTDQLEVALKNIQQSVKHVDYALAARLVSGKILRRMDHLKQAASEYLEALKLADVSEAAPDQAEAIGQLYEPLIESIGREKDLPTLVKLCENVNQMLMRPNWRQYLQKMRDGMPNPDGQALPLAEIIIQAQSNQVIDAMKKVNELDGCGFLRSATDEAFHALVYAPTYLPLHIMVADLMLKENRTQDAITKLGVVASAYSMRGEANQATAILRRVIQLAPMDMNPRNKLIDVLTTRGLLDEALSEYFSLADIYYRLAELDMARKVYTKALHLAQQPNANRSWSIRILQQMADIDMQRLDWRQAIRVYEQLRTLTPNDDSVRESLIETNLRLGQTQQAQTELEAYLVHLENKKSREIIPYLRQLLEKYPGQAMLARALADQLHKSGQTPEATTRLVELIDVLTKAGDNPGVVGAVNQLLLMNPPNADQYRAMLARM